MSAGSAGEPDPQRAARGHRVLPRPSRWTRAPSAWPSTPPAATAPTSSTPSASPTTASSCTPPRGRSASRATATSRTAASTCRPSGPPGSSTSPSPGDVVEVKNSDRPDAVRGRRRHLRLGHPVGRVAGRQRAEVSRSAERRPAAPARFRSGRRRAPRPTAAERGSTVDTWVIVLIVVVASSCCWWCWRSPCRKRSRVAQVAQAGAGARAPAGGAGPRRPGRAGAGARRGAGRPRPARARRGRRSGRRWPSRRRASGPPAPARSSAAADELRAKAEKIAPDLRRRPARCQREPRHRDDPRPVPGTAAPPAAEFRRPRPVYPSVGAPAPAPERAGRSRSCRSPALRSPSRRSVDLGGAP